MTEAFADYERQRGLQNKERDLIRALLITASEPDFRIPTISKYIASEVVNGTLKYCKGDHSKIKYKDHSFENDSMYLDNLSKYFKKEMSVSGKELPENISGMLLHLLDSYWDGGDCYDKPYCKCGLYWSFGGFCGNGITEIPPMQSSFELPREMESTVRLRIMPSYSELERKAVIGIGKEMSPFLKEDLEFISKRYAY